MSSHFMDNMATEIRITTRILQETWGGMTRTGWMNLIIIVTMASILSIFGTLSVFVLETQLFVENIGSALKISVYAKDNVDVTDVQAEIIALSTVKSVELVTKEEAWDDMKKNYQVPDIQNPLPNTFHVQVKDQEQIKPTVAKLKTLDGVEEVNYAKSVLDKLQGVSRLTSAVGLAVSIFLGTLTFFIISNTIHLLIEARGREIEIMRMMGVGNWYIRLPFLLQGAFYGLVGASIALVPLMAVNHYISLLFNYFQFSTSNYSSGVVTLVLFLMGVIVGSGGAAASTRKYLRI
ncbi:cell division protein FtsX [Vampirovibrio chlorellavorus]|uniref:cell division protein FtsX n=1 Tax=Vampirovibrio chlorellavorus TaxID=758823 RepID=UPI0026EF3C9A|nr:permease-like cell division protein FtsX [Vampirovibrio chlorellavorus]